MRRLNLMMRDLVMMHRLIAEAPETAKLLLRMQARLVDDNAAGFCPVCMDPDGDASQLERGHLVDCALATVLKDAGLVRGAR
jgi:hypothetical protein